MDADYIINSVKQTSETLYREPQIDLAERLLYRIQMLEGHIRVLVNHIDNAREEIKTLQTELIAKDSK
jgi:chaperonin cofactor prefoldin